MAGVDGRTVAYRAVMSWKQELLRDLGGQDHVSSQRLAIIDMAVRTRLFIDHIDSFLLVQRSLINKRRKAIIPLLRERQSLVDSLSRLLAQLGLERQAKPVESLQSYLARRERESASAERAEERDEEPPEQEIVDEEPR
jgi:hypothetical protein